MAGRRAVVDGANVAYEERRGAPRMGNIVAVCDVLGRRGFDPLVVVDASLRHDIDDPAQLEAWLERGRAHQAPSGTDADYFILELADREDAIVVSNDTFSEHLERFPWVEERRVPLMIVEGEPELYEPRLPEGSEDSWRG